MKKYEGKLAGILGTVIVHLITGIIFMSFQLQSLKRDFSEEFEVEFAPAEETETEQDMIELPATSLEEIFQDDKEMLNIARNLASRSEENIDPAEYIDRVKEELIESGKLGTDNYIDEQKKLSEMMSEDKLAFEDENNEEAEEDQPKESQKMAANYQGPTRIYYELEGRNHIYLPIPIYKCEGSGKVALAIEVSQKGIVEKAEVIAGESTTSDPCLIENAVKTAHISRFNPDINAPKIQRGTLTYHFVAQ